MKGARKAQPRAVVFDTFTLIFRCPEQVGKQMSPGGLPGLRYPGGKACNQQQPNTSSHGDGWCHMSTYRVCALSAVRAAHLILSCDLMRHEDGQFLGMRCNRRPRPLFYQLKPPHRDIFSSWAAFVNVDLLSKLQR